MLKLFSLFILGILIVAFSRPSLDAPASERRILLVPPRDLIHFTLGYNENIADGMWLRVIQDLDYCEQNKPEALLLGSADKPADKSDGNSSEQTKPIKNDTCKRGWVFHMIDAVTELAPRFRIPYVSGALMLSTVVNDAEGATVIYNKALQRFQTDWHLQYYAANHFLNDGGDPERAATLLVEAGKNGAPTWVYSLAGRLFTKAGKAFLAKTVLTDALQGNENERWAPRLQQALDFANEQLKNAPKE